METSHRLDWTNQKQVVMFIWVNKFFFRVRLLVNDQLPNMHFTADDLTTSRDQSHLHSPAVWNAVWESVNSQEPRSHHRASHTVHYSRPESHLTQQRWRLLLYWWGCHLRCNPCSQALKAQWFSDSRMWKCHESCPASYGAYASPGTGTELELGRAWGWQHMRTQGPHSEWKCNPTLESPSPRCLLHWAGTGSSVMGSALRCMCLHVVVYVTVYIIWVQRLLEVTVRVRRK